MKKKVKRKKEIDDLKDDIIHGNYSVLKENSVNLSFISN